MVSVFGFDVFGLRIVRLLLLNIIILLLNISLWTNDSSDSNPRRESSLQDPTWKARLRNPPSPKRREEVVRREFQFDYDEDVQREAMETWRKTSKRINKNRLMAPMSSRVLNGTKRMLRRREKRRNVTADEVYSRYQVPKIPVVDLVNCEALLDGDAMELDRAEDIMKNRPKVPIYEEQYLEMTKDCGQFRKERGYIQVPLSREEEDFPLAFSLAVYRDVEQIERLLRAIYQPQNLFCIHVDTKSPLLIHQTILSIARCFDNVWVSTQLVKVKWGDISVILPEINCMTDLLRYFRGKYKYLINLTGQEFPLRTNLELVRIAKIFNGSNDIAGSTARMELDRVNYRWTHRWSKTYQQTIFFQTSETKTPYPVPLTFFKGELHALFSGRMTEYIIESEHGRKYLEWCWDTGHPSEHYWNTINYNPHLNAPGGYDGPLDVAEKYSVHPIIRVKNWVGMYDQLECNGRVLRGICVYGVRDAPWLAARPELFANKFNLTYDYLGLDCLEERHRNRTMARSKANTLDEQFYRSLPTVKYGRKDGI